jgi:hypothetical protein
LRTVRSLLAELATGDPAALARASRAAAALPAIADCAAHFQ